MIEQVIKEKGKPFVLQGEEVIKPKKIDGRTLRTGEHLKAFRFPKGKSGNPNGRPKGQSMKDFAREFLEEMDPKDKKRWLAGLPPEIVWRMAEGNPHNTADVSSTVREVVTLGEEDKARIEALFPPHALIEP